MTKTSAKAFSEVAAADLATFGEQKKGLDKVQEFLTRFGYLQPRNFKSGQLDSITSVALQKYQEYNGLLTTGEFDSATRAQMTTHRCGHSDLQDGVGFVTRCAWDRRDLTYAFDSGTNDVAGQAEFQAVRNAFQTWAAAVPITFTEVDINANPDILIDWRDANDPDHSMVGGVLAHADFPPGCGIITNTLPKPVHFDDSEHAWSIGAVNNAFDIETVALHEIGHILGLQHTSVNGAVMFPSVSDNFTLRTLQDDDLRGIRDLYPPAPLPLPLQWSLVSQTAGFGSLLDGQHPIWIADFTGVGHAQVMFYYAGDGNWWLADMVGGQLQWSLVSQTAGFGSLLDGQHPIWIADFTGVGHAQVMFYYAGDGNWWLADMVGGQLQWSLVSQTAGFGSLLDGQHPIWIADFTGVGHAQVMFYYAGDGNWWLADMVGGQLQWSLVSQTAGFGSLLDGQHPIWIADFTGVGHAQVMFYYAGDGNWWLADMVGGQLQWSLVSQTAGFGSLLDGQHPIWIADFTGVGHAQVMFYYAGDGNWWLADMVGGQLQWSLVSQTAGFGSLLDGQHPIWIADFTGVGHAQVMFYYAGDGNWWLADMVGGQLQWSLVSQTAGFGSLLDGQHPIWIADFTGVGHAQVMFYYVGDGNWWLADMVGGQLQWSLVSQTAGFGSLLDGQHPIWIADFTGVGHAQVMFYYAGDGNWWLGNI